MLDIQFIRENSEKVKKGVKAKQLDVKIVDKVLELDEKRRSLLAEVEELRAERNKAAKEQDKEKGAELKTKLQKVEPELKEIEESFEKAVYEIPNLPADDVKAGKDEGENEILKSWGEPRKFDFKPKSHWELGENLGIIDTERGSKVSGSRFFYLKKDGVSLELALIRYGYETLLKEGFIPVVPPVLIKEECMREMGYMEHGGADDMYILDKDNLILVGTSEQSIGPMHKDEIFKADELPLRYLGISSCFRREAGSSGKDTKGAFRVHQFNKVEMFSFVAPEKGDEEHEYLLSLEEKFLQGLGIPYQVSKMCSGDLGSPAARKYDLEAWFPGEDKYRELTSTSTTTDFQARRLNIKYQDKGKTNFVHMLNGTVFSQRPILAILENYQEKDGSIKVPEVLQKWMGKDRIASN
ncbi:MAG: serine--tRNA ligase [Patescibacteria group bacterium]